MSPAPTQVGIKVSQSVSLLDFRQVSARLTPSAIAQWRWLMGYFFREDIKEKKDKHWL